MVQTTNGFSRLETMSQGGLDGLAIGIDPVGSGVSHFTGIKTVGGNGLLEMDTERDKIFHNVDYDSLSYRAAKLAGVVTGLAGNVVSVGVPQALVGLGNITMYYQRRNSSDVKY